MAEKTDRSERAVINLSPAVRDRLNDFRAQLAAKQGRSATQSDLIGALLYGVPLWQADLMLRAYLVHSSSSHPLGVDETEPESGE